MEILVVNGPNLDLLGTREPETYGSMTLGELEVRLAEQAAAMGVSLRFEQSNHEGALIDAIHAARSLDGVVINAGALTHTSRALGDAITAVGIDAVEVHISNIHEREAWRAVSLVSESCVRTIYGRGVDGYRDAIRHLVNRAAWKVTTLRYGPHQENQGDLRLPAAEPKGTVVLVHGGFWRRQYERDATESLAVALAGLGWATWNVEYRRLGVGGGWPGSGHDVATAARFVPQLPGIETGSPVVLLGHSAGGYLALWASGHSGPQPLASIGLAPVTDLEMLAGSGAAGSREASALLAGGAPPRPAPAGPSVLVHGTADDLVPIAHSRSMEGAATVHEMQGMRHFAVLDPARDHWPLLVSALDSLV